MNDALHNKKRERVQRQWIKRKHNDMFRGSSPQLYVPVFIEKDFQSTKEYRTPLSTLQCHRGNTNSIHLTMRDRPLAKQPQITSTEEGYKPIPTPPLTRGSKPQSQPLPKREQPTKGFYNKWYISTTNNLFSHKQMILIEQDR